MQTKGPNIAMPVPSDPETYKEILRLLDVHGIEIRETLSYDKDSDLSLYEFYFDTFTYFGVLNGRTYVTNDLELFGDSVVVHTCLGSLEAALKIHYPIEVKPQPDPEPMTKLNINSGFGLRIPETYREYKELLDLLKYNGVQVQEQLYYNTTDYPDSEQCRLWYEDSFDVYRADIWKYWGVVVRGGKLVTFVSDSQESYYTVYDSVEAMVQERAEKSEQGVDLSDRIEGFDAYEITLSVGDHTVSFTSASNAALGNEANDPIPALTCLHTLEQVAEALQDDSVTVLWGWGKKGVLIRPDHLSQGVKLESVANMMKQGVYVAAKK